MSTPSIQAIPTRYAGCHFRSRLEARWAVFFDHLGIEWEYEPQGFLCTHRLTLGAGTFPYLPDFWLPQQQTWVEVKGGLTEPDLYRLLDAAASLSSNDGGGCHDNGGHDVVVLGPVPRLEDGCSPARLHMHKGDLQVSYWDMFNGNGAECRWDSVMTIARDYGGPECIEIDDDIKGSRARELVTSLLLSGVGLSPFASKPLLRAAYTAARSARFEHGETPR